MRSTDAVRGCFVKINRCCPLRFLTFHMRRPSRCAFECLCDIVFMRVCCVLCDVCLCVCVCLSDTLNDPRLAVGLLPKL